MNKLNFSLLLLLLLLLLVVGSLVYMYFTKLSPIYWLCSDEKFQPQICSFCDHHVTLVTDNAVVAHSHKSSEPFPDKSMAHIYW